MAPTELDQEMKAHECATEQRIDGASICLIRLDGVGFSKYTRNKCFTKPFSNTFAQAMIETSRALFQRFNPQCIYTSSDEITLILRQVFDEESQHYKPYLYNGRVQKLASISAATATAAFNDAIQRLFASAEDGMKPNDVGLFDARVFTVPDQNTAVRNVQWRASHDAARNSFAKLARHFLGARRVQQMTRKEMEKELDLRYKVSWQDLDTHHRFGTLVHKEATMKDCVDHKTGDTVMLLRRFIVETPLRKELVTDNDALRKALFEVQ